MQTATTTAFASAGPSGRGGPFRWLSRAEAWLDARGKGAWIAAMVAGFIAFWPIGLALVFYMTMTGKWHMRHDRLVKWNGGWNGGSAMRAGRSTGNAAFDSYKAETLRRLEDEQQAFEDFLRRLREAKDKAEFDQFMDERTKRSDAAPDADAA